MGRFALLVTVLAGLVLATAAPAFADTTELYALAYDTALGRSSDTELDVLLPASGPAAASLVFYSPQGYGLTVGQAAGTKIGTVVAASAWAARRRRSRRTATSSPTIRPSTSATRARRASTRASSSRA